MYYLIEICMKRCQLTKEEEEEPRMGYLLPVYVDWVVTGFGKQKTRRESEREREEPGIAQFAFYLAQGLCVYAG